MTIPAGTLVPREARDFGNYQLLAKLATGGMAEIYLARPANSFAAADLIVVKRILPHLAEDEHFVQMFRDEADLASKLVHKNVCQVLSFGQFGGTWFIAMEYLHGVPLSKMMTRLSKVGRMLDYRIVAGIICQACEGLHSAHEARDSNGSLLGVVHRDVSPPNIMVTANGTVKLLDFGIAKAGGASSRTRTGTVKGKNAYMSPEQILGRGLDRRSDVFALGVVMYEMLSIRRLFHRESDFLTFKAITEEVVPDIRECRPDLPSAMRAALVQAMARDPDGRFESAQAFSEALRSSVATLGGPASPQELARFLFKDFGEEMSARDEILQAADDPAAMPVSVGVAEQSQLTPAGATALISTSGEVIRAPRPRGPTGRDRAVPSMIVGAPAWHESGDGQDAPGAEPNLPAVAIPVDDLSVHLSADADGGANLLLAHRKKAVRNIFIVFAALLLVGAGVALLATRSGPKSGTATPIAIVPADAAVAPIVVPPDAEEVSRDDIVAISKFGFFSITANAKTTIYVDGKNIGETPLTRLPIKPGPHTVRAVGPRGKSKTIKIAIIGGRDTDEGTIEW